MRAAKLNSKIPTRSEDKNKMEIEFPQSGMFPPSGMHNDFLLTNPNKSS